jgi:hypothetical protein
MDYHHPRLLAAPKLPGYAIMSAIKDWSDDVLRAEEGTLYPALHRMEEAGWIRAEWIKSRKEWGHSFRPMSGSPTLRELTRQIKLRLKGWPIIAATSRP